MGTWTPNIGLEGTLSIQYRADTALVNALKYSGEFTGWIHNRQNIGKSGDELVRLWNEQNPDDQVL